jgi:hypothetical protein
VGKRSKQKKREGKTMLPNLSGVSFKDALKALLKTPVPPNSKKKK